MVVNLDIPESYEQIYDDESDKEFANLRFKTLDEFKEKV